MLGLQTCAIIPGYPVYLCVCVRVCVCVCVCVVLGVEPRGLLPPTYTSRPFLYFIWKQGLTKLLRASQAAEAGFKPAILLSQPPKYWDYKCSALLSAILLFFIYYSFIFVCVVVVGFYVSQKWDQTLHPATYYFPLLFIIYLFWGMEPRGLLSLSYTSRPILYFILKQGLTKLLRASLSC